MRVVCVGCVGARGVCMCACAGGLVLTPPSTFTPSGYSTPYGSDPLLDEDAIVPWKPSAKTAGGGIGAKTVDMSAMLAKYR